MRKRQQEIPQVHVNLGARPGAGRMQLVPDAVDNGRVAHGRGKRAPQVGQCLRARRQTCNCIVKKGRLSLAEPHKLRNQLATRRHGQVARARRPARRERHGGSTRRLHLHAFPGRL